MTGPITYMRIEPPEPNNCAMRTAAMTMTHTPAEAALSARRPEARWRPARAARRPADSASAAPVGIDLVRRDGHAPTLPGRATPVPVWGYCRRSAADTRGTVDAPGGPTLV